MGLSLLSSFVTIGFSLLSCCAPRKSLIEPDNVNTQPLQPLKADLDEHASLQYRHDVSASLTEKAEILLEEKEIRVSEKEILDYSTAEERDSIIIEPTLKPRLRIVRRGSGYQKESSLKSRIFNRKPKSSTPPTRSTSDSLNVNAELERREKFERLNDPNQVVMNPDLDRARLAEASRRAEIDQPYAMQQREMSRGKGPK